MKNEREESKTELICETDAYVYQTKSSVLNVSANEEGKALLELDRTVFSRKGEARGRMKAGSEDLR